MIQTVIMGNRGSVATALSRGEKVFIIGVVLAVVGGHLGLSLGTGKLGATLHGYDEQYYFATLRSLVLDGDFDFKNEFERLTPVPRSVDRVVVPQTGRYVNKYGTGWALWALPPYLVAHGIVLASGNRSPSGYEAPYQASASSAHALAGALCVILAFLVGRRYVGFGPAATAALLVLFGTPLLYHATYGVHMAHTVGALGVAGMLWASVWLGEPGGRRRLFFVVAGASFGLAVTSRYSNALFGLLLLHPLWLMLRRPGGRSELVKGGLLFALGAAPAFALQLAQWRAVYGSWFVDSYGQNGEGFLWLSPNFLGYLLSHRHGVLFSGPLVLLAWIGLALALLRRQSSEPPRTLALSLAAPTWALVYLNACWHMWWFGASFGCRSYLDASAPLVVGLALLWGRASRGWRRFLGVAAALSLLWTNVQLVLLVTKRLDWLGKTTASEIVARFLDLVGLS